MRWAGLTVMIVVGCGPAPARPTAPGPSTGSITVPGSVGRSTAPPLAARTPAPAPPRLWLRGGLLRSPVDGTDLAPIASPVLVELVPEGRVRVVDSSPVVEGVLPIELALRPSVTYGLGLYVTRETTLHLGAADGPAIGRAVAGVYLPVTARGVAATEIVVPGYYDRAPIGPDGIRHSGNLRAFVATADLGLDAVPIVDPVLDGQRIRAARMELEVEETSLTTAFTTTECAELRILSQRLAPDGRRLERMAQYAKGVELVGWAHEDQDGARGGGTCAPRTLSFTQAWNTPRPAGYVMRQAVPPAGLAFHTLVRTRRTVYIPFVDDAGTLACHAFRFDGNLPTTRLVGRGAQFRLSVRGEGFWIYLMPFQVVEITKARIAVLASTDRSDPRVEMYHPDDAEHWYFEKAACDRNATHEHASLMNSRR